MLAELGQICLVLAVLVALVQSSLPLVGAQRGDVRLMRLARPSTYLQLALVAIAFALLTAGFVVQDFSIAYVANNSNTLLPMAYRFSAVWGAHEGSLLLWVLTICIWAAAVARFSRSLPLPVIARVLAVMGWVCIGFLLFTLLTSNPFDRALPVPVEGRDLNPLLQDPGLIIHPPMLYAGYVGFSVAFAFAIAALLEGKVDARWVRWSRPWTLWAWAFLTLGIALGSWWAYYELGWGGWWFWDPVENASFLPWLVGTALIHSQAVTEKRGSFVGWTLLLAIAAFSLSLLGTFLVRSGVLTSVHAFASDPERGLFILAFLGVVVGGSLLLYALRAPKEDDSTRFAPLSRETFLLVNNLLFSASAAMVLLGTLYPLFAEALDLGKISVGPPYFALLFTLLMIPVVMLLPLGPFARWQREVLGRFRPLFLLAAVLLPLSLLAAWWAADDQPVKTWAGIAGGLWVMLGTAIYLFQRLRTSRLNGETAGMLLAHFGVGVFVFGVLMTESTSIEKDIAASAGEEIVIADYAFRFAGVRKVQGPNYQADQGEVTVLREGKVIAVLRPEKRAYASGGQVMTEAAIAPALSRDLYVALGESLGSPDSWALRVYVKPWIRCIWLGALLMMFGAIVAAGDARFRRRVPSDERSPVREAAEPA
jgi:cytochrome c-type biogenesis protein CcmF